MDLLMFNEDSLKSQSFIVKEIEKDFKQKYKSFKGGDNKNDCVLYYQIWCYIGNLSWINPVLSWYCPFFIEPEFHRL